jgi:CheY-like chemotaxis protein
VFRVELPLARSRGLAEYRAAKAERRPASGREAAEAPLEGLRVLLAEDHPINRRVVELILGPLGVRLEAVENGERAVRAFERGRYDAVLMDMQMPILDGLRATRAIRGFEAEAGRARTPVVMLSANAMREHSAEALAAGADLHLPKPVTAAGLLAALQQVLGGRETV